MNKLEHIYAILVIATLLNALLLCVVNAKKAETIKAWREIIKERNAIVEERTRISEEWHRLNLEWDKLRDAQKRNK